MDNSRKGDTVIYNSSKDINVSIDGKTWVILIQILLIILKCCGLIIARWWVILLPTIIPIAGLGLMVLLILIAAIFSPTFRKDVMKKKDDDKIDIEINGEEDDD